MPTVVTRNDDDVDVDEDDDDDVGDGSSSECEYKNIGHFFTSFAVVKLTGKPH